MLPIYQSHSVGVCVCVWYFKGSLCCKQELMERAVVLTQGGGQPQASPALGDLVAQYSTILASQVNLPPTLTHFLVSAPHQYL